METVDDGNDEISEPIIKNGEMVDNTHWSTTKDTKPLKTDTPFDDDPLHWYIQRWKRTK